jgi:murein tripeptide amidase MpaA
LLLDLPKSEETPVSPCFASPASCHRRFSSPQTPESPTEMKSIAAFTALLAVAYASSIPRPPVSYDGFKVFRVGVGQDTAEVDNIVSKLGLETWEYPRRPGSFADIVVGPEQLKSFEKETTKLHVETMHEDLGASIADETTFQTYLAGSANATWFNSYHSYADHVRFLTDLQTTFPGNSRTVSSGRSLNGNNIAGIHVYGSGGPGKKPAIVFHGTVHAREWITTMVVEYFAWTLLSSYSSNTEIKGFVDKYDFYFFPIVNPDGFLYTQTNDRMWRKNRQTTSGSSCLGHDINRNWPFKWEVTGGASTNPCAQDYRGTSAGSAPETQALSSFLRQVKSSQGVKLYMDWHSYSQLFMTPYGYSCTAVPAKNTEFQRLAAGVVAAIRGVFGTSFTYGPICTTIYQATGSSVDYVNDVVGADYTFTAELRDTGRYGFVLPTDQIVPSGQEAWAGVRYLLQNMK